MKLNPEQHGKGREVETQGRRSSFARARSQLTQAVGDVLSGRVEGKRQGGWLTAFTSLSPTSSHAERLREVVIRDRALAAANPGRRRSLREEEEEEAALAAERRAEAPDEGSEAGAEVGDDGDGDLTIVATSSMLSAADASVPSAQPPALEDDAVRALADALDAAAQAERTPEDAAQEATASEPSDGAAIAAAIVETAPVVEAEADAEAVREAAPSAEPVVAVAEPAVEPTPLEQIAAKATKVKSKAGARESSARPKREPIRTRTMARLLASQGHRSRALSIYDELLAADASDATLREEAEALRAQAE